MPGCPVVLLFKGDTVDPDDVFLRRLNDAGFRTFQIPVLSFTFVNQEELKKSLRSSSKYSGLILTSKRTVRAVEEVWSYKIYDLWNEKKVFVVGPHTAKAVKESLHLDPLGEESGNAAALRHIIHQNMMTQEADPKPLLLPQSSIAESDFQGLPVERLTVYETRSSVDLTSMKNLEPYSEITCVFFSPSGVQAVLPELRKQNRKIRAIAIGKTTAGCLSHLNQAVDGVCEKPTSESLLHELKKLKGKGRKCCIS